MLAFMEEVFFSINTATDKSFKILNIRQMACIH